MTSNYARLGRYVQERRTELGYSQVDLWQAGGPSNSTLTNIESGSAKTISPATRRKLDRGLKWAPGSADRILEGGEPTLLDTYLASEPEDALPSAIRKVKIKDHEGESDRNSVRLSPRDTVSIQVGLSGIRDIVSLLRNEQITADDVVRFLTEIEDVSTRIIRTAIDDVIDRVGRLRYLESIVHDASVDEFDHPGLAARFDEAIHIAATEAELIKAAQRQREAKLQWLEAGGALVKRLRSHADNVSDDPSKNPYGLDKRYFMSDEWAWKAVRRLEGDPVNGFRFDGEESDDPFSVDSWDEGDREVAEASSGFPTLVEAYLTQTPGNPTNEDPSEENSASDDSTP